MEDDSDAAVIAASLDDPARFGTIFDRHATVLHRYLVRRLGPDEAEAIVGDVFRIAFEKRHTYDPLRPLAGPGCTASPRTCWPSGAARKPGGSGP